MNWNKVTIQGTVVDGLFHQGKLLGYVKLNQDPKQPYWRLYLGDNRLFFQVYDRGESMRVLEEVMKKV
jgi:hypothetical protein